ncbi:MAG: hypothetical protein PF495_13525 [Spirochaetales bacterium]|jgi:hypothetical protein|nr:hypothetical protein [Spirochaetales bacterium]
MLETVRAKFECISVTNYGKNIGSQVSMTPVIGVEGDNKHFSDATPSGEFNMYISSGVPAENFFKPGKSYYLDISEAKPTEG